MRERWFGATGRQVPEVALEGTLDIGGALDVDGIEDTDSLVAAHRRGTPVVVRASTAADVLAALARPEVSCVLVRSEELLALDLPEITYG
jgi:hypothetical protein